MSEEKVFSIEELTQAIRKAAEAETVVEFEYPYISGLYFNIAYASKHLLQQILDGAKENYFNPKTRMQEERTNSAKFNRLAARQLVRGWKGLTVKSLKTLIVGLSTSASDDTEIPYSEELAYALMDSSLDFQNWVVSVATDVSNFSNIAQTKAEQYENLK